MAHEWDLRAELPAYSSERLDALCNALKNDWRAADLSPSDLGLCAYADKLTRTPALMCATDADELRSMGFKDVAIHDAIQVVAYFNYINRVADAVHVELEPEMPPYPGEAQNG